MKLIRTNGRGATNAATILAALEQRGGAALDGVLPAVTRIVADVRRKGIALSCAYASKFDRPYRPRCSPRYGRRNGRRMGRNRSRAAQGTINRRRADPKIRSAPTSRIMDQDHLRKASPPDNSCGRSARSAAMCPAAATPYPPLC